MDPSFLRTNIEGCEVISIYPYNQKIKELIYQYKGCYDYELKDVFLSPYLKYLKIYYRYFVIVPAPSSKHDDMARGFNHVEEIAKGISLNIYKAIYKIDDYKQSNSDGQNRDEINNHIRLNKSLNLYRRKILIIDDVLTTGSTIKAMIKLLSFYHPKEIRILTISKVVR